MGTRTHVDSFFSGTGGDGSTVDVTLPTGFNQPVALEFWGCTTTSDFSDVDHARFYYGIYAGGTQGYVSIESEHNRSTTDTWRRSGEDGVGRQDDGTGTQFWKISVDGESNWPANGFRIVLDDDPGFSYIVNYRAWGGVQAQVNKVSLGGSTVTTTTNFRPSLLLAISSGRLVNEANGAIVSVGWSDGTNNFCAGMSDRDNVTTTEVGVITCDNRCAVAIDGAPSSGVEYDAHCSGFSDTGYDLVRDTGSLNYEFQCLALRFPDDVSIDMGTYTCPTTTGADSLTVGFESQTASFMGMRTTVTNVVQTGGAVAATGFGFGSFARNFATDAIQQRCTEFQTEDNQSTSDTHQRTETRLCARHDNTSAMELNFSITGTDSTDLDLNLFNAPSGAKVMPYLAVEVGGGPEPSYFLPHVGSQQLRTLAHRRW